jgi:hypothetical protein
MPAREVPTTVRSTAAKTRGRDRVPPAVAAMTATIREAPA